MEDVNHGLKKGQVERGTEVLGHHNGKMVSKIFISFSIIFVRYTSLIKKNFLGGSAHGPRNPTSYFYRLAYQKRIMGLTSTLSVKFAQDDLKIVDNINIPTEESSFITDLMEERHWGLSVLIVDT